MVVWEDCDWNRETAKPVGNQHPVKSREMEFLLWGDTNFRVVRGMTSAERHILTVHVSAEVPALGAFPETSFGLHVDHPNFATGNLVQLVRSQAAA
jgi:hypothetical protein